MHGGAPVGSGLIVLVQIHDIFGLFFSILTVVATQL